MPEQAFPAHPVTGAGGRIIATPFQFYTTGEENVRVVSVNAAAGVVVGINGRFRNSDGTITPLRHGHTPATNRTTVTSEFTLGIGAVLDLTVFATSGAPLKGQTYVLVQLIRGSGAAAVVVGLLLGGYVTATQGLGFPGSPIISSTDGEPAARTIIGATPGAGAELSEAVPTGARWEVLTIHARMVASGTVANRVPQVVFADGANSLYSTINANQHQAGQTWDYYLGQNLVLGFNLSLPAVTAPIPVTVRLLAGQLWKTVTAQLQAGDQWAAPVYTVREWLEVS
jgi:hypothetical protein